MGDKNKFVSALKGTSTEPKAPSYDDRLYATIYGEVGGGSAAEVGAVTSVFLNRAQKQGYEKALKGSAAYNKKSKQYMKAYGQKLNTFENIVYKRNKVIVDDLIANPKKRSSYTHFENVKTFGDPSWASSMSEFKDIGRQRFYKE